MMNKTTYIKVVVVVFGFLILSRIPAIVAGNMDSVIFISTLVEIVFFAWGTLLLMKK
jgi:hypothetical protein